MALTPAERARRYRERNPDKVQASRRNYYQKNAAKRRAATQQWKDRNREHVRQYARDNRPEMTEADRARLRSYATPANRADAEGRRRARKRGTSVDACPQVAAIYAEAAELRASGQDVHVDHVIPLSKGGTHTADNLQIVAAAENLSKGSKLPEDFYG